MICPRCGASGADPCRTPRGRETARHKGRLDRELRSLELAVRNAAEAALWITATDQATLSGALRLAREIDDATAIAERVAESSQLFSDAPLAEQSTGYALAELARMLGALGLSPKGRRELGIEVEIEALDELDSIRKDAARL